MEAYEDLFDLYINNELKPEDKATFEERLLTDEEFKLEYELHLDISQSVKYLGKTAIIEQLQEIEYNLKTEDNLDDYKPTKNSGGGAGNIWVWLFLITMGIGIAVAAYLVSNNSHLISDEDYFKSCNQLYVSIVDDRDIDNHRILYHQKHSDSSDGATEEVPMSYFRDTVNVCIIFSDSFSFHYTYTDTLTLYGNMMEDLIRFASKPQNRYDGYYNLIYNGDLFELIPHTTKITPLKRLRDTEQGSAPIFSDTASPPIKESFGNEVEDVEQPNNHQSINTTIEVGNTRWDSLVVVKLIPRKGKEYLPEPAAWGAVIKQDTINNEIHVTRQMRLRDTKKFEEKYQVIFTSVDQMAASEKQAAPPSSSQKRLHKVYYDYKIKTESVN